MWEQHGCKRFSYLACVACVCNVHPCDVQSHIVIKPESLVLFERCIVAFSHCLLCLVIRVAASDKHRWAMLTEHLEAMYGLLHSEAHWQPQHAVYDLCLCLTYGISVLPSRPHGVVILYGGRSVNRAEM